MGNFSITLNEFEEFSSLSFTLLMDGLKEDHCWKCPMRSTSDRAFCREIHAWLKIQTALEKGVSGYLAENYSDKDLNAMTGRFMEKRLKKEEHDDEAYIFIKNPEDSELDINQGDWLLIKPNPRKVKKDDIVLIPQEIPCPISWFLKASFLSGVPFKMDKVLRIYHKGPSWFAEIGSGEHIPVSLLMGVLIKKLEGDDPLLEELG